MALPKVGVQVIVQDMAKFTRDMAGVEKSITKMSGQFKQLGDLSFQQGAMGLANVFADIGMAVGAAAGPVGLVLSIVQALMIAFEKLTAPIKRAWNAIKDFAADLAGRVWESIKKVGKAIFDFLNPVPELFDLIKRTASIAFGVLVRDTIRNIGEALKDMALGALEAASNFQLLEIRLRGLALRDLMEETSETRTIFRAPTDQERLALFDYTEKLAGLKTELGATQKAYDESVQSSGAFSKESLELKLKLEGLTNQVAATSRSVSDLTLNEDGLIRATQTYIKDGMEFNDALGLAQKEAKSLLLWVSRLAIQSPFSTQDVANALTMAKGFGLTTEMAKSSTEAVMSFAAGMGLSGDQMERILINFGQMWQQGKIAGTELRDLARGSLVPTTRIFELMGKKVGKTAAQMRTLAKEGKVSVADFINAFNEMAMTDFPNAAKNMTRTLEGLKEKVKDFGETYFGMFLIKPALDVVTGRLSDFFDLFMGNENFLAAIEDLGLAFGRLMKAIFNPDIDESVVDKVTIFLYRLVGLVDALARGDIDKVKEIILALGIPQWVINTVENLLIAWENFNTFFDGIKSSLKDGITDVLSAMGIDLDTSPLETFSAWLRDISTYLSGNAGTISGNIQNVADQISRFITILRTGEMPKLEAEEPTRFKTGPTPTGGIQAPAGTSGFDKLALNIHNMAVDTGTLSSELGSIMTQFGEVNAEPMERIGDAFKRIFDALGGFEKKGGKEGELPGILRFITGVNETTATVLEKVASAVERIRDVWNDLTTGTRPSDNYGEMLEDAWWDGEKWINPETGAIVTQVRGFTTSVETEFTDLARELVGRSIIPDMLRGIGRAFGDFFSLSGILSALQTWSGNISGKFTELKTGMLGSIGSLVSEAESKFNAVFRIGSNLWNNIGNWITGVLQKFKNMWDELTRNSIIPDMMDDIEKEMVGGFKDTFKQSSKLVDKFTGAMQSSANYARNIPFSGGNIYNNRTYNLDFNANYAQTQSPVTVKYDIEALLAGVTR